WSWGQRTYQHPAQGKRLDPGGSVRQRDAAVDQGVDRGLHVDVGLDHAGLLERETRGQDRFTLRRADLAVGQLGALLELLVHHRVRQLGCGDEDLLELVVVAERILARL